MKLVNQSIYQISRLMRRFGITMHEENDPRVIAMKREIQKLGRIEFRIEQHPDGVWSAESVNIDGIITGGDHGSDISASIKDAVFTFFEIPPQLCNDILLRSDNEPVTVMQRVYV